MGHRNSYTPEAIARRTKFMDNYLASALTMVLDEMERNQQRILPKDPVRRAALICEEAGEVIKRALDFTRGETVPLPTGQNEDREEMKSEVIQTVAMSLVILRAMLEEEVY